MKQLKHWILIFGWIIYASLDNCNVWWRVWKNTFKDLKNVGTPKENQEVQLKYILYWNPSELHR